MRHVGDHQSQLLQKGEPVLRLCNGTVMPTLGFGLKLACRLKAAEDYVAPYPVTDQHENQLDLSAPAIASPSRRTSVSLPSSICERSMTGISEGVASRMLVST